MDNKKDNTIDEFDDEADIGPVEDRKKKVKEEFITACKKGNIDIVLKRINNQLIDVLEVDENQWTPLMWAIVNNHPEVVKIVYKKQREEEEKLSNLEEEKKKEESKQRKINDIDEAFKKPLDPAKNGKYTPLHWAAYKGFDLISSILLKMGCDPLRVDGYGNNALHQAAASNILETFKLFMGLGMDLELKNSRSHMAIDLTTNKEIQELIKKTLNVKKCQICNKIFDFFNKRYICSIHEDIICKDCAVIDYYYVSEEAKEKEMRDCRCVKCQSEITKAENELKNAIESNELNVLNKQIEESFKYKICLHLKREAKVNQDRMKREKEINELLDSLKVVADYKTIKKSIDTLEKMVQSAYDNKVDLNSDIIQRAFLQKNRLEAERDLRQLLDNITVEQSTKENLDNLSEKVDNAKKCNVDTSYIGKGELLLEKISDNLKAKELLNLFVEYPIREYPIIEPVDPKKKNKATSPPKKKKKKKEPPFNVPEWAKELTALVDKVNEMKGYIEKYKEIGLNEDFYIKSKAQIERFGKEIPFRKEEEETLRKLEEEKSLKKKKLKAK